MPAGGTWEIRNRLERDIELLTAKFPDLDWESVNIVVPDGKDIPTPLVLLPSELGTDEQDALEFAASGPHSARRTPT